MRNHIDLTHGIIACVIATEEPLPSDAFAIIRDLAEHVEHCAARLANVMPTQDEAAP